MILFPKGIGIPPGGREKASQKGAHKMSMEHKGYAFDWQSFASELHPILLNGLETGDTQGLINFIASNREQLTDPYAGAPLKENWHRLLSNCDIHEYGDYALTKYYEVGTDRGLGYTWREISDQLPVAARKSLLGKPLGPQGSFFDPGRMGSYFQAPAQVAASLEVLRDYPLLALAGFCDLLAACVGEGWGVYITF